MASSPNLREELRVLELYSGIGGMHWALKESGIPFKIVMAVDINTTANEIYRHNFPDVNLYSFGIEKLSLKQLQSLRPNAILMSPPCQPFSRVGKKGDCDDVRTQSFLHVLQLLRQTDAMIEYILVENVKGFETSRTRELLVETLRSCQFSFTEFLLNPLQYGIPNSRLRYYMVAKRGTSLSSQEDQSEILYSIPTPGDNCDCDSTDQKHSRNTQDHSISSNESTKYASQQNTHLQECSDRVKLHGQDALYSVNTENPELVQNKDLDTSCTQCKANQARCDSCKAGSSHSCVLSSQIQGTSQDVLQKEREDKTEALFSLPNKDSSSGEMDSSSVGCEVLEDLVKAGRSLRFGEEADLFVTQKSRPLADFMETFQDGEYEHLLVEDKSLRQFVVMDVVLPSLKKSACFTKRYGHFIDGAGSLVQMSCCVQDTLAASDFKSEVVELKNKHDWGEKEISIVRRLRLRYFSPREVANLLCFPKQFGFPDNMSDIRKYRCLGNSLNVHVVAKLIKFLLIDNLSSTSQSTSLSTS